MKQCPCGMNCSLLNQDASKSGMRAPDSRLNRPGAHCKRRGSALARYAARSKACRTDASVSLECAKARPFSFAISRVHVLRVARPRMRARRRLHRLAALDASLARVMMHAGPCYAGRRVLGIDCARMAYEPLRKPWHGSSRAMSTRTSVLNAIVVYIEPTALAAGSSMIRAMLTCYISRRAVRCEQRRTLCTAESSFATVPAGRLPYRPAGTVSASVGMAARGLPDDRSPNRRRARCASEFSKRPNASSATSARRA